MPTLKQKPVPPPIHLAGDGVSGGDGVALVAMPACYCRRCGHRWVARTAKLPKQCSKCHSPYWAIERQGRHLAKCPYCEWERRYRSCKVAMAELRGHIAVTHTKELR